MKEKLFWPSTYHYVKDTYCKCGVCEKDGNCEECQYGTLRCYAARDTDYIRSGRNILDKATAVLEYVRDNWKDVMQYDPRLKELVEGFFAQVVIEQANNGHWTGRYPSGQELADALAKLPKIPCCHTDGKNGMIRVSKEKGRVAPTDGEVKTKGSNE